MLTHRERRFLEDVGFTILDNLAGITVSTFLHGTFLLLLFLSTSTLFRQRAKSLSTLVMFGTTIMSFLLASLYWTAYISFFARYIRKALIDSIHTSLNGARLDDINESNFKVDQITIWTRQVLQIMGDAIVVWRAWALCTRRRWVMLGPVVLFLGTCATSFAFLGLTSTHSQYEAYIDGEVVTSALYNAAGSLSLATNGVATISIAFMLWSHRKSWNTGIGSRWSRAQSILLMIIESGAIDMQLTTVIVLNELYDDNTPMVSSLA